MGNNFLCLGRLGNRSAVSHLPRFAHAQRGDLAGRDPASGLQGHVSGLDFEEPARQHQERRRRRLRPHRECQRLVLKFPTEGTWKLKEALVSKDLDNY